MLRVSLLKREQTRERGWCPVTSIPKRSVQQTHISNFTGVTTQSRSQRPVTQNRNHVSPYLLHGRSLNATSLRTPIVISTKNHSTPHNNRTLVAAGRKRHCNLRSCRIDGFSVSGCIHGHEIESIWESLLRSTEAKTTSIVDWFHNEQVLRLLLLPTEMTFGAPHMNVLVLSETRRTHRTYLKLSVMPISPRVKLLFISPSSQKTRSRPSPPTDPSWFVILGSQNPCSTDVHPKPLPMSSRAVALWQPHTPIVVRSRAVNMVVNPPSRRPFLAFADEASKVTTGSECLHLCCQLVSFTNIDPHQYFCCYFADVLIMYTSCGRSWYTASP